MRLSLGTIAAYSVLLFATPQAAAASVHAAIAANFTSTAAVLAAGFAAATGNEVKLSFGATGALYTQISQAAPFDVFFAADDVRPTAAIAAGLAVAGTEFTYALGRLALYAPTLDVTDGAAILAAGTFQRLAIANPKAAPYGAAALALLEKLGLTAAISPKLVTGENVTQTLAFVESGSAELGFVALSQVQGKPPAHIWIVPPENYPPIRQNAVLLKSGADNPAAIAFLAYLKSDAARALIEAAGYAQ